MSLSRSPRALRSVAPTATGSGSSISTSGERVAVRAADKVVPAKAEDWRYRAACLGLDSEMFFPIGTTGPAVTDLADAQQVCARCQVREDCLRWAMDQQVEHGVWGGLSEEQRRSLRRRSARRRRTPIRPS